MNQHARLNPAKRHPPGPRRFTVEEFMRMGETGVLAPDERVELIGGEIIVMSPAGRLHEVLRTYLAHQWSRSAPAGMLVAAEMQLRVADDYQPVADIGVLPLAILPPDARGPDMLLVVEIADSSLDFDLSTKAPAYAAGGVREYLVINAMTRTTLIHGDPDGGAYRSVTEVPASDLLTPALAPELTLRLADLPEG